MILKKRVCAFVDFLGWKKEIKNLSELNELKKQEKTDFMYNILIEFFTQVDGGQSETGILKCFDSNISSEEIQIIGNGIKENDFQFTAVSDCVVISIPYPDDDYSWGKCLTMFYMLAAAQKNLLSFGYLCRGGISCGDLVHISDKSHYDNHVNIVFGKAQIDAIDLEKKLIIHVLFLKMMSYITV